MSKIDTTAIDQEIRQKFNTLIPALRARWSETKNVMAPNSEDSPRTWRKTTASETLADEE
jgi:hypothetical protein